jgi:hypothetical protein
MEAICNLRAEENNHEITRNNTKKARKILWQEGVPGSDSVAISLAASSRDIVSVVIEWYTLDQ